MSTNLYKVSNKLWVVIAHKSSSDRCMYPSIEEAATQLESLGVPDEEIDIALIEMVGNEHNMAQFGALEGRFIFSSREDISGIFTEH